MLPSNLLLHQIPSFIICTFLYKIASNLSTQQWYLPFKFILHVIILIFLGKMLQPCKSSMAFTCLITNVSNLHNITA